MADEYDPSEPQTYDAADDNDSYDPAGYQNYDQDSAADGDEDDDYDPSSFSYNNGGEQPVPAAANEMPPESRPAQSTPRTKTIAGFIVEESDDEQDASAPPPPTQQNGTASAHSGFAAVAAEPELQDVSLSSAPQDAAAASTSLIGSTTVPVPASHSPHISDTSLHPPASDQGKAVSPVPSASGSAAPTPQPPPKNVAVAPQQSPPHTNGAVQQQTQPPARLPHDKVGQLEDRIKDDPKGDTQAWLSLIDHYYDKGQYDYSREIYKRFFKTFPTAVSMWIRYVQMEKELDEKNNVVHILNECLMQVPSVEIWKFYLDHVRRELPLINDADGTNRGEITKAFELTLDHVGIDPDAGVLWREYIDFIRDGPGTVGGSQWQDLQKVDLLRKAYQRAIKLPHSESIRIWKEYEAFEMGLHKATGRKHIQEQSPHYIEARKARTQLDQKLDGLDRRGLPQLPPIYGCAGEEEFGNQVEKWQSWVAWERDEDPLVYKGSDDESWRKRVLYAYRQATIFLSFYPQIWYDAASWCFSQNHETLTAEGEQFLDKGIEANPESVLLAMMKVDRIESTLEPGNTDEILIRNGEKLDVPFENVHTALYALRNKMQDKDKRALQQVQDHFASFTPEDELMQAQDEDEDEPTEKPKTREEQKKDAINAIKAASADQLDIIKRTISYVWVAKMRAFRRVQGQGKPQKKGEAAKKEVKGFRGIFSDARPRGPLSSDVYSASALMEHYCYKHESAKRIFERGYKIFPNDENFTLEYIKHLIVTDDVTNARVVFESTIPKITNSADLTLEQKREKCRPLFVYMHDYESKYGDLAQIHRLEKRMAELYPEEPEISRFSSRLSLPTFDAMHTQLLLSPTQAKPKPEVPYIIAPPQHIVASLEQGGSPRAPEILLGPNGPYVASPKRPLEDSDVDSPQRKFMRAESPLKGAGGMRVQQVKATVSSGSGGFATKTFVPAGMAGLPLGPTPLPPGVETILRQLPPATSYDGARFNPAKLMAFMPSVDVDFARAQYAAGRLPAR